MRRIDNGHVQRPPPFRVLAASDGNYLSPSTIPPPPPRAPEPYKIASSSTSSSRAHRRSSFVIIADSRPASPQTRSPSPTLATGRVSPFRGRGFKGPPPRSRSRPQSPDHADLRRKARSERRVSVSQQSSPRRSLIPQPTRQRSTSLSKSTDCLSSPKGVRRTDSRARSNFTDSRNRLNVSGNSNTNHNSNSNSTTNLATRRQTVKTPSKLSPIQGTPTKPDRTPQFVRRDRTKEVARSSPLKSRKPSPSRNAWNSKKLNQEKGYISGKPPTKERLTSPSKIPLKANRVGTNSLNPARFINISNQPNDKGKTTGDKGSKEVRNNNDRGNLNSQSSVQSKEGSKESEASNKNSSGSDRARDFQLIELLKQSSGATGTSSVVNTTATTAVQPLHIDANAILMDRDASEKRNPSDPLHSKSSNSSNDDSVVRQAQNNASDDQRSTNIQISRSSKPGNSYGRSKGGAESRNESPVPAESIGSHSKSNSISQSVKNLGKTNGTTSNNGSATLRSTKNQSTVNEQSAKNTKLGDQRIEESISLQPVATGNSSKLNEAEAADVTKNSPSTEQGRQVTTSGVANAMATQEEPRVVSRMANEHATKIGGNTNSVNVVHDQSTAPKANDVSAMIGAVNGSKNVNSAGVKARTGIHGSGISQNSSAGMSVESIDSVRTTDTGVSVNTVRGVSSPREKTGMHVVKRPQEIETLSGNVVHLEQNGEPARRLLYREVDRSRRPSRRFLIMLTAWVGVRPPFDCRVLVAANGVSERPPERFFTRWKRSLSRCCQCCPSMRCLACRTHPKGLAWPRNNTRTTTMVTTRNETEQQPAAARDSGSAGGCWPKFKNRCRCTRLREIKCCSRRSRIAPAEAAVCCPPERRFGTICRRLFHSCNCCKQKAEAERTRSIRAKHSLTSVAPPPLSEEPKAKIPDVLVEHNSLMRGAIPCLPVPLAWFCLVWNVLLPGSGTVWSGIFNLCSGQPRFSAVAGLKSRLGAFVVNLVVGVGQLFTVLFCLVGWGWSIWWGVTLVRLARKYKRFKASEAASNDPEARGGESTALPPGVPSQALRGMERAR
ncbi:mechanosensory transduction mediator stumble isoform X2 [Halictus rubicundus]|uniref:mechanosensory transduction mediator stumble isoform X2 n=1 Tax=Halictus rubicundus TaxID=77578 RepID=UPI0040355CAA